MLCKRALPFDAMLPTQIAVTRPDNTDTRNRVALHI